MEIFYLGQFRARHIKSHLVCLFFLFVYLFFCFGAPTDYGFRPIKVEPMVLESWNIRWFMKHGKQTHLLGQRTFAIDLLYERGLWQNCTGPPWISLFTNFMGKSYILASKNGVSWFLNKKALSACKIKEFHLNMYIFLNLWN